jgi:hypothetical protein
MASAIYVCFCHGAPISKTPPNHMCQRECSAGIHYDFCELCKTKMLAAWVIGEKQKRTEEDGA